MIQLFLNSGLDVLRYGLQNGSVRLFLAAELVFVLLGAVLGRMALTDAHIWLPPLAEDLVAFSIVSCAVLAFRTRRGRTDGGRR